MSDERDAAGRYRFGVFEFDAAAPELRKHGRRLKIRPQSLKLLKLLLDAGGDIVSRERIHATLWGPDVFVDFEQGVNHCIKELRRAFGDDASTPRYIETLPRRGYRFITPFTRVTDTPLEPVAAAAPAPGRRRATVRLRWVAVAAVAALAGLLPIAWRWKSPPPSTATTAQALAVLPFETRGLPATASDLGVGLADAVIARVGADGRVGVRPISAVLPYRGGAIDVRDVSQGLAVAYVLQGIVHGEGENRRVELTLADSAGRSIWQGTVAGRADELERIERDVADNVLATLQMGAGDSEGPKLTKHPLAHEAFLEGRYYLARFTGPDTLAAIKAFERALSLDAEYARAHAGLAMASAQMYIRFGSEADIETWKSSAEQHALRALELDSRLAEAHEALAAVARYTEIEWEQVIDRSFQALRFNPALDLPHYYIASALQHVGRLDLVEAQVVAGLEANPLNLAEAFRLRGVTALWSGRFQDARAHLEHVRDLTAKPVADAHLAAAVYYGGDAAAAEKLLRELTGSAQAEQRGAALLASLLAARGDRAGALEQIDLVQRRRYRDHHVVYNLGTAYAGLGLMAEAIASLQQSARTGFLCHGWYETDPLLKPLRGRAEFVQLIQELKRTSERVSSTYFLRASARSSVGAR
jgi:DNA-binding winged helix-turn-helix (wHTH) protein/TolB-like protein